ncbi:MAG TPA: SLBB domain-containing protein [Draconibacterium sp.]|nr:SLBB domain-containing protein [Draconibacterium sp.]
MHFRIKLAIFLSIALISSNIVYAQDIKSVDVKAVPQSDIQKAQKAMQEAGLSTQDAANLARQKGATEQQIQDFESRLQDRSTQSLTDSVQKTSDFIQEPQINEKSQRQAGFDTGGQIFGAYLFNNKNLTFNPSINIQTPKNYEIGIGDQILINIWGNSQSNYQLTVNTNGQIMIPDVGPVYIAGSTFQDAENKIIQRLTSIYSDMGGSNPQTFAQVNMGQLRSIQVNLLGEVTAPGTYTLPVTATVFNGLYLSGGPNSIGSFRNIKIIRNDKVYKTIDIYKFLVNADPSENILLKDDDIIFIPAAEKRVEVNGEFKRNGIFELKEGEMLSDLIRFAGGFTENSYLSKTQIYRKTQQGFQISDVAFTQLASTSLINGDEIRNKQILSTFENRVTISGAVFRPGEYEWHQGLTLYELIMKADSILPDAFQNRGIITRYNPDLTTSAISFNVGDVVTGRSNVVLFPEDMVLIKSHFELKEQPYIIVNGEVLSPGTFSWSDNLTLGDAIFLAGGFTEGADSTYIEVARRLSYEKAANLSDTLGRIIIVNMSRDLKIGNNDAGFQLKPYDQVSVRQAPNFRKGKTVYITGEVVYAGAYAVNNKQQRISDLIKIAGGITPQAYINGATLQRFTDELGSEQVAIDLKQIITNPGSEADLYLNNGDKIYIPEFMQTVKITGSIQNPFSITFETGKSAKYYIDRSGGFNSDAHKKKTFVRYANGTTAVTKGFIIKNYPEVQPGSQIIVPQKPVKQAGDSGKWLAFASVLASLAVSIATVVSLTN